MDARYDQLEHDYLKEKLASQIDQRESRIARLEAMEREDRLRGSDRRSHEKPLRRSHSRDKKQTTVGTNNDTRVVAFLIIASQSN